MATRCCCTVDMAAFPSNDCANAGEAMLTVATAIRASLEVLIIFWLLTVFGSGCCRECSNRYAKRQLNRGCGVRFRRIVVVCCYCDIATSDVRAPQCTKQSIDKSKTV